MSFVFNKHLSHVFKMKLREDQARLQGLLKETITLLCKNGLQFKNGFVIDALIGITADDGAPFLVKLEETVGEVGGGADDEKGDGDDGDGRSRASRKRPPDGGTHSTPSKRHRSDDDDSDNDFYNDDDTDYGNIKREQDDGDLLFVKQEQSDYDGQFAQPDQSQAYGTAPDGSSFDGSHDGSSAWNQSSANDPNASGSQQVRTVVQ